MDWKLWLQIEIVILANAFGWALSEAIRSYRKVRKPK